MATVSFVRCRICGFEWPQTHSLALINSENIIFCTCQICFRLVQHWIGSNEAHGWAKETLSGKS